MKIAYSSDLHLDFFLRAGKPIPTEDFIISGADVLFLCGDIVESRWYEFAMNVHSGNHQSALSLVDFFNTLSNHYDKIFMVAGNHEFYFSNYSKTISKIKLFLQTYNLDSVVFLNNESFNYQGFNIYGGTAWTDMGNPADHWFLRSGMNDFRLIMSDDFSRFTPHDASLKHAEFIKSMPNDADIIIMHHAPSILSVHERFKSNYLNPAYHSNVLENMLLDRAIDRKCPMFIFHGHMHDPSDYWIGDNVRVLSNPYGYPGEREDFSIDFANLSKIDVDDRYFVPYTDNS